MTNPSILYVEDDINLGFVTQDNLQLKGYDVTLCKNGVEAEETFNNQHFDLCILDIMLPKLDGYELAKRIRSIDGHVPIIFLSAKSLKEDKLMGLRIGADDYLTKPFSIEELLLKIEIFLKRSRIIFDQNTKGKSAIGTYTFDADNLLLKHNDEIKTLTHRESQLLQYLSANANKVLKRDEILNNVWGDDDYFNGRSMDVFISRLRGYLKKDTSIEIKNIHGVGFIFHANVNTIKP